MMIVAGLRRKLPHGYFAEPRVRVAPIMDRLALVRAMHHPMRNHNSSSLASDLRPLTSGL
ncbi:MAG TPA: hypothetical protein VFW87_09210 [Pirellulales bacterium]|nr:hypothetical protein [Pirellulales bacterium]